MKVNWGALLLISAIIGFMGLIVYGMISMTHKSQAIVENSKFHVGQLVQTTSNQGNLKGQIKRVFKNELDKPSYDLAIAGTTFTVQVYEYELEALKIPVTEEDIDRGLKWLGKIEKKVEKK